MSAVILPFPRRMIRAVAVAELVRLAALRLGYKPHHADRAASLARADFLTGRYSAAMAIGRMVRDLRAGMAGVPSDRRRPRSARPRDRQARNLLPRLLLRSCRNDLRSGGIRMNPFDHLDAAFAKQFGGLPKIESPIAPGLAVTEYRMDGLLLGNADIEMNNHEAVHGICADGD